MAVRQAVVTVLGRVMRYEVFDTALGPMGVVVRDVEGVTLLTAVRVGHPTSAATEVSILDAFPDAIVARGLDAARLLIEYADTGVADFSTLLLDDARAGSFDLARPSAGPAAQLGGAGG